MGERMTEETMKAAQEAKDTIHKLERARELLMDLRVDISIKAENYTGCWLNKPERLAVAEVMQRELDEAQALFESL